MRKRESYVVSLSVITCLLFVAPAFALVPYGSFSNVYDLNPWSGESSDWQEYNSQTLGTTWTNSPTSHLTYNEGDANWGTWVHDDSVGAVTEWTLEFEARVSSQGGQTGSGDTPPAGLYVGIVNSAKVSTELVVQSNNLLLRTSGGWISLSTDSNTSDRTFRIVNYGGVVEIYRDGATDPVNDIYYSLGAYVGTGNIVQFGDKAYGGDDDLSCVMDYIAFDLGNAYAPEPATMILLAVSSLACVFRKRR